MVPDEILELSTSKEVHSLNPGETSQDKLHGGHCLIMAQEWMLSWYLSYISGSLKSVRFPRPGLPVQNYDGYQYSWWNLEVVSWL